LQRHELASDQPDFDARGVNVVTANQVKELRELTGAGIMECKRALVETDGNVQKATDLLKLQGLAKAEKKSGRSALQGVVEPYIHAGGRIAALVEVNCETDFVARTTDFKTLAHDVAMQVAIRDFIRSYNQRHSATVHRARAGARGERGDGLWTDEPGLPVLAMSADCLPLALARTDGTAPAVAVLHAGWRGLLAGIVDAGVAALGDGPLAAAVGPAIGPCCYEVRGDVAVPFRARFGRDIVRDGKLDLWRAAELALTEAGVTQVERTDICTSCHPELFFSHRRDGKPRGVQGVLARVA